ncbi:uncharacterized protein LOC112550614 [Alligator sinensis]|uniref:ribonuclease H n=1 Tax=Alligator sinensis TaxID=38654 RepID=A0A3Q0GRH0_ALLSI|nr:uncharacterized protein LOC112550614 [Alligator sinensis]
MHKPDRSLRLCVDYRLNTTVVFDTLPMPHVAELVECIGNTQYIMTLDLVKGYWQIPTAREDQLKTAFRTPWGLYEFMRMPFGLHGAAATFQRLMDWVLAPHVEYTAAYIDDIVVFSQTRTNASETAVRAVLTQEEEGAERPVAYTSRKLLPAETRCTDEAQTDDPKSQAEEITNLPGARGNKEACCRKLPKRFISHAHLQLGPGDATRRHLLVKIKNQPGKCRSRDTEGQRTSGELPDGEHPATVGSSSGCRSCKGSLSRGRPAGIEDAGREASSGSRSCRESLCRRSPAGIKTADRESRHGSAYERQRGLQPQGRGRSQRGRRRPRLGWSHGPRL